MPIFRVKSVKIYTGQKNLHRRRRPRRRQLSGMSISAIGLLWKEKWKMMLVRYQASTDGTQVRQEEEDRWTPPPDYNLVNNLRPSSPAPGLPLPSNNTNNSISISWSNPEVKLEAVNHDDSGLPTYEQAMSQI